MVTLTPEHALKKPDWKSDRWDVPTNENWDKVDDILPIKGGLASEVLTKASNADNDYVWAPGGSGSGLDWETTALDTVIAENGKGYLVDTTASGSNVGLPVNPEVGDSVGVGDWKGTAANNNIIIIADSGDLIEGSAEPLILDVNRKVVTLVFANATQGWVVITTSVPDAALINKPLFHLQDKVSSGIHSGSSIVGGQTRSLNTIVTNEIPGASLVSNVFTLPAGDYYIEATAPFRSDDTASYCSSFLLIRTSSGNDIDDAVIRGPNDNAYGINEGSSSSIEGRFTLTETTGIVLRHLLSVARATDGLGGLQGSLPSHGELYADVRIWRLDIVKSDPVVIDTKLYPLPGNTIVTGGIIGLGYAQSDTNSIIIQPGTCFDSLNSGPLVLSFPQELELQDVAYRVHNLFLCDDGVVRYDVSEHGDGLTGYRIRWIGFCANQANGALVPFIINGNMYQVKYSHAHTVLADPLLTTFSRLGMSQFAPVTKAGAIQYTISTAVSGSSATVFIGYDNANIAVSNFVNHTPEQYNHLIPPMAFSENNMWFRCDNVNGPILAIGSIQMKR